MPDETEPPDEPFDTYDLEDGQCPHTARCLLDANHKGKHSFKPRRRRPSRLDLDLAANPGLDHAAVQSNARDTSEYAKWSVMPRTGSQRLACLEYIIDQGETGATHQEIHDTFGFSYSASTTRPQELEKGGWIVDSGMRRTTRAGNPAIVWVLSEQGKWRLKELEDG